MNSTKSVQAVQIKSSGPSSHPQSPVVLIKKQAFYTTLPALIPTFQSKLTRFYFPDGPNDILVLFRTFVRQKIYMEYIVDICEGRYLEFLQVSQAESVCLLIK